MKHCCGNTKIDLSGWARITWSEIIVAIRNTIIPPPPPPSPDQLTQELQELLRPSPCLLEEKVETVETVTHSELNTVWDQHQQRSYSCVDTVIINIINIIINNIINIIMSCSDLRDRMDGLQWEYPGTKVETIMPGTSFLTYSRGDVSDTWYCRVLVYIDKARCPPYPSGPMIFSFSL